MQPPSLSHPLCCMPRPWLVIHFDFPQLQLPWSAVWTKVRLLLWKMRRRKRTTKVQAARWLEVNFGARRKCKQWGTPTRKDCDATQCRHDDTNSQVGTRAKLPARVFAESVPNSWRVGSDRNLFAPHWWCCSLSSRKYKERWINPIPSCHVLTTECYISVPISECLADCLDRQ